MTWHYENKTQGVLRHPSDGEAWKHFDRKHESFASDPRNVRLGLCSDGFNPYIQASSSPYSCWPVIVTPYNLPPEMCMTKPFMFLTCLIPGVATGIATGRRTEKENGFKKDLGVATIVILENYGKP